MHVIRPGDVAETEVTGALFPAGRVTRQSLVSAADSAQLSFTLLSFNAGARNAVHTHTHDQVIIVVSGTALAGTGADRHEVRPGEMVLFPAGESHWHEAAGEAVSFISITPQGTTTSVKAS